MLSSESAQPRGLGYLRPCMWYFLARAWASKALRKLSAQIEVECYSKPIWTDVSFNGYARCRDIMLQQPSFPRPGLEPAPLCSQGICFDLFFSFKWKMFNVKKVQEVCLDWHGSDFWPDLCAGLVAWRERNNKERCSYLQKPVVYANYEAEVHKKLRKWLLSSFMSQNH